MTIPKGSVTYGTKPTIYIDSQMCQDQGYTEDNYNYYVWYITHFSTHEVSIVFTENSSSPSPTVPPDQTQLSLPQEVIYVVAVATLAIAFAAGLLFYRRKHRQEASQA
jgi:hypothetical protein